MSFKPYSSPRFQPRGTVQIGSFGVPKPGSTAAVVLLVDVQVSVCWSSSAWPLYGRPSRQQMHSTWFPFPNSHFLTCSVTATSRASSILSR